MSDFSVKSYIQHPAYGLRDRCPNLFIAFRKCIYQAKDPYEDCKGFSEDYQECIFKHKQRHYAAQVDDAIDRQRQKFTQEVNEELSKYQKLSQKK